MTSAASASDYSNRKIELVKRPVGLPDDSCWKLVEDHVVSPGDGEVLVKVDYVSIDPAMRAWVDEACYIGSVGIGETMRGLAVGTVLESGHERFAPGDSVQGPLGVQRLATVPAGFLRKLEDDRVPASAWIGALGLTGGLTAYFGTLTCGELEAGDIVLVSAAAGAVGSMVGQIARIKGASRVIGIAGGPEKVRYVIDELGFDDCIDYKNEDVFESLGKKAPDGIDLYFDNVGGEILDAALEHIRSEARVVICGAISQYNARGQNDRGQVQGPRAYLRLAEQNARMEGFVVSHFQRQFAQAEAELADWIVSGQLVVREHVERGVERFPATLRMLFDGSHTGKLLLAP